MSNVEHWGRDGRGPRIASKEEAATYKFMIIRRLIEKDDALKMMITEYLKDREVTK